MIFHEYLINCEWPVMTSYDVIESGVTCQMNQCHESFNMRYKKSHWGTQKIFAFSHCSPPKHKEKLIEKKHQDNDKLYKDF